MLLYRQFEHEWTTEGIIDTVTLDPAVPSADYWVGATIEEIPLGGGWAALRVFPDSRSISSFQLEAGASLAAGTVVLVAVLLGQVGPSMVATDGFITEEYVIKAGTTGRPLTIELRENDGESSDLSNMATVTLRVLYSDDSTNDFVMSVSDAEAGLVTYEWSPGETDIVGLHTAEVIGIDGNGDEYRWPARGYFTLEFTSALP